MASIFNMSEEQAHQFVARWSRRMITWRARNETEQLRDLSQSCSGLLVGALLMVPTVLSLRSEPLFQCAVACLALPVGAFALWMVLQLRQVRQALNNLYIGEQE